MFGRGGVASDATTTSRQGCGESTSRQLRAITGDWSTGCSSSNGEEDKSTNQEAEIEELRGQVEWFRKHRGEAGQEEQSGSARKGSGLQEDLVVKVEEEFENGENKRKLDEQRKRLQK